MKCLRRIRYADSRTNYSNGPESLSTELEVDAPFNPRDKGGTAMPPRSLLI